MFSLPCRPSRLMEGGASAEAVRKTRPSTEAGKAPQSSAVHPRCLPAGIRCDAQVETISCLPSISTWQLGHELDIANLSRPCLESVLPFV